MNLRRKSCCQNDSAELAPDGREEPSEVSFWQRDLSCVTVASSRCRKHCRVSHFSTVQTMTKPPIPFCGFDEQAEVRIYRNGLLPHWRQTGCTYFVTFRLADSIPKGVADELNYERRLWLGHRGIDSESANWKQGFAKLPKAERRSYERLVGNMLNKSLDECLGSCSLRSPIAAKKVHAALVFFDGSRLLVGDYVVMPNHVHVLMTPINGFELEDILHSIKSFSASRINLQLKTSGQYWHRDSYDHIVRDFEQLVAYQEYIAANPSKAGLREGEYVHVRAEYRAE
jgi:putative transposase